MTYNMQSDAATLHSAPYHAAAPSNATGSEKQSSDQALQDLRVLVVDDSPTVLAYATEALESAGAVVCGSEDMWISHIISDFQPDIIMMDVNLGSLSNGPIAVKALKKRRNTQNIPIVLYSSTAEQELLQLCLNCGADGYIEKTDRPDLLVFRLANALQQIRNERAS